MSTLFNEKIDSESLNCRLSTQVDVTNNQRYVIILGPCRSGTTALLQVFASAGFVSHFQPFKRNLGNELSGFPINKMSFLSDNPVIIKETYGPFVEEEVSFSPIRILIKAGVNPQNITLIAVFRNPEDTFLSWKKCFEGVFKKQGVKVSLFLESYAATYAELLFARDQGAQGLVFVPEFAARDGAAETLRKLFRRISLPANAERLDDWVGKPSFGGPSSLIRRENEPNNFRAGGILDDLKIASRYVPTPPSCGQMIAGESEITAAQAVYKSACELFELDEKAS